MSTTSSASTSAASSVATSPVPCFGVSQPISIARPTSAESAASKLMIQEMISNKCFETKKESEKRIQVLEEVKKIVTNWEVEMSQGIEGYQPSAQLLPFGSYKLNVHSPGGDIDTVLVAPLHLTRGQFFTSFVELLRFDERVTDLSAVPKAFVPIVTLKFEGVEVDILFARLTLIRVPTKLDLSEDTLLEFMDEACVRSLNGCRVAEKLLSLVPNQKTFTLALRAVKLWAKRQGISCNAMGFFGGITWAILVARVCQLYPNATCSRIVMKVFTVFSTWKWPIPVVLDHLPRHPAVWNPKTKLADSYHLMPILTPAFPQQNTTHNVSASTCAVITQKLKEGMEVCQKIQKGQATWADLFKDTNFFLGYKHFIAVDMKARDQKDQLAYTSFLESRIRHLVGALEANPVVTLAHVHTEPFQPKNGLKHQKIYFIGLQFSKDAKDLDLTKTTEEFKKNLEQQSKKAKAAEVDIDITYVKRCNLFNLVSGEVLKTGRAQVSSDPNKKRKLSENNKSAPPAKRILKDKNC